MAFRVEITPEAEEDGIEILEWLLEEGAGETGLRWFRALNQAIDSLEEFPKRCKVVEMNAEHSYEVRELLYGHRPHVYRILFTIQGQVVQVLRVRHGRRLTFLH